MSQYANSPRLTQLVQNFDAYVDQTANLDTFFSLVWNIDTAVGWGLDVWGRIVGVSRVLKVQNATFFGFGEAGPAAGSFDVGAFYVGGQITENYSLTDDAYRTLILAKALANICDGSIPSMNALLMKTFPNRGNAFVTDGDAPGASIFFGFAESQTAEGFDSAPFYVPPGLPGSFLGFGESSSAKSFGEAPFYNGDAVEGMKMTYTFQFPLTPLDLAIVEQSGVLPKPVGVSATVVQQFV